MLGSVCVWYWGGSGGKWCRGMVVVFAWVIVCPGLFPLYLRFPMSLFLLLCAYTPLPPCQSCHCQFAPVLTATEGYDRLDIGLAAIR